MANISYIAAASQCLPGVGPLVSLVRACRAEKPSEQTRIMRASRNLQQMGLEAHTQLAASPENAARIAGYYTTQVNTSTKDITALVEKSRVHSICALVGQVLTIASLVALITLGMFNVVLPAIFIAILAIDALGEIWDLHHYNRAMQVVERAQHAVVPLQQFAAPPA